MTRGRIKDTWAYSDVERSLLAPGGHFEVARELVLGAPMCVFRTRAPSLKTLLERSQQFGEAEYLVFGDRRLSYVEHYRLALGLAAELRERFGVGGGDRVAILGANAPEWILTFWAAVSLGALPVGLNAWWAGTEIHAALADCRPKLIVGDEKRLGRLRSNPNAPVLLFDQAFALATSASGAGIPHSSVKEDDPAAILYTSGTTGEAKGVVSSHRNIVALLGVQFFHGARMVAGGELPAAAGPPCLLSANPLFHVSGLYTGAVAHLAIGAKSVWTVGRFDAGQVIELIEKERVTGWAPHGSMGWQVLRHPSMGSADVSSVRTIGSGGAPVSASLLDGLRRAFPNARATMGVGYGLTESTALATLNYGEDLERLPNSVGRPLPTVEVEIRDGNGTTLPEGEEGEITLRSPLNMLGYWEKPAATAACLGPDRWLRTGDLGRLEAGRLFVAARQHDLILRGAEKVYPQEIEARIERFEGVLEAAVVGTDHAELGQEVKAVVVPQPGTTLDVERLRGWVAETLAYYKVPTHWEVRQEPLPRNAMGKLVRHLCVADPDSKSTKR